MIPAQFTDGDYPSGWDEFIGQDNAKARLKVAAASARMRKAPMDHCLIASGVPGVGKTSLALLTAAEMDADICVASGVVDEMAARLAISGMRDGDVFFIDEAHRMVAGGKSKSEWLLHYLQDGVICGPYGPELMPQVTVIAATTEVGKLPEPVVDRFMVRPAIEAYTDSEAARIAGVLARKMLPRKLALPADVTLAGLAAAGNNNPRAIRRVLTALRDLATVGHLKPSTAGVYDMSVVCEWAGVTPDGLDRLAQRYLCVLLRDFNGQAGAKALQDRLHEAGLGESERVLVDKGLVVKTRLGRVLTTEGAHRARALEER